MTLNASGPISLAGTTAGQSIEIENGGNGTTQISLNDGAVRTLAGVTTPNSTITMPTNFYGKSNRVVQTITLSSSTANYTFNPAKISGYVAGKTCATLTINSGVYVYSTSTGSAGLSISGWTSGDVVKVNNRGVIAGQGGNGGNGGAATPAGCGIPGCGGGSGGTALSVSFATTICNSGGIVAGGGGGGGGGGGNRTRLCSSCNCCSFSFNSYNGGGGGGGGRSGLNGTGGGSGGCASRTAPGNPGGGGNNGGPGGGGSGSSRCQSGQGNYAYSTGGSGATGGGWGSGGGTGGSGSGGYTVAPGWGTRCSGVSTGSGAGGGGAGPATSGNGNITWSNTGTRYGPLN